MILTFYQLDVFTDRAFGGNPLAVFPDATGLDTPTMQKIALEMNLSETTFVFPPEHPDADFKLRIFTPGMELPFAGHPVVGTHWLLATLGRIKLVEPVTRVKFELGVGIRGAALNVQGGRVTRVIMDHQKPQFFARASAAQIEQLERALGLATGAIQGTNWPVQVVSTGIRQLFVPVCGLDEVRGMQVNKINGSAISELCKELDPETQCSGTLMVVTLETTAPDVTVHTRVFIQDVGVPEDPATGSASGGLGAYLVENHIVPATMPTTFIVSEQGLEMGRPSRIEIEVDGEPGNLTMVRVAGRAVPLIEGTLTL
jgi:trans-2,3-dihydro-3-hydroxyanthranilate isomerase